MSVNYEKGNIVWVRLNGLWWPGEVCPEEQEAIQGKIPLAVVKFFNEDSYSYIFTPEQIHPYQCEFKKSLMKMSLTSTRIKADDLKKLKEDIITAEQLTGGNENILNDKDLYQKKAPKTNTIVEQLFGTPKKESLKRKKKSNQNNTRFPITHKRFIMGFTDDYKEMVLIQSIGKDRIPDSDSEIDEKEMEEIRRLNETPKDVLKCQFCDLETINVDLLLMHTGRCYDNFKANNGKPKKSSSPKKTPASGKEKVPRKTKVKEKTVKKRTDKETPKKSPKKPAKPELNTSNDIDTIVNDWEDNDLEESESSSMKEDEEIEVEKKTRGKPAKKLPKKQQKPKEESNKTNDVERIAFEWDDNEKEEKEHVHETAETDKNDNKEKENCFNFDENEEDAPKSSPPMKKPTTDEPAKEKNTGSDDEFKQIMDTTQAPEISPEIKNLLKSQQNFPNAKTVKIPDKPQPSKSPTKEATPILTNPKKRILNNFEQQQLNKVPQKTKEEKETVNETLTPQKSPEVSFKELKEGIMSKLMTANTKRTRLGMHSIRPHAEEKEKEKEKETVTVPVEKIVEEKPKVPCKSELQPKRFFPSRQRKLTGNELVVKKEPVKVDVKEEKTQIEMNESKTTVEEEKIEDTTPPKSDIKEEKLPEIIEEEVKKVASPKQVVVVPEVEEHKCEDEPKDEPEKPIDNEIVFKSANKDSNDDFNISIKTNLTNLSKAEEMSAFTLATLSTNMLPADSKLPDKIIETPCDVTVPQITPLPPPIDESELVPIEGNVTIVPEKVLADGEVELTANAQPTATLMNFSMDFSDTSNGTVNKECAETVPVVKKPAKKSYERRELLEILEGNQEKKPTPPPPPPPPKEECDFDDMIPSQIITPKVKECDDQQIIAGEKSKLMERLTTPDKLIKVSRTNSQKVVTLSTRTQFNTKPKSNKPIILSEEIIKPATNVKKRTIRDVDVDHLITKKMHTDTKPTGTGKAKILQQTIITPAGEIIQPVTQQTSTDDVTMFDFDSMPIILSDGTITPESLENMPVMLQNETTTAAAAAAAVTTVASPAPRDKIIFKKQTPPIKSNKMLATQLVQQKIGRQAPRILHTMAGNKVQTPSKSKYVIVSQTAQTKKQQCVIKKGPSELQQKLQQEGAGSPSGNKVMILTNQQGVQQRLLLTPSQQQKYFGYQNANVKTVVKGGTNVVQKVTTTTPSTSGLIKKPSNLLKTQSSHQLVTPQLRTTKTLITKQSQQQQQQKVHQKPQKTIVIKDQQGHIVRKIQGNDDALLEQQVAEQIQAIKQQQLQQQQQQHQHQQQKSQPEILNYRAKTGFRRSYASKNKQQALIKPIVQQNVQKTDTVVAAPPPPLAPLSPEKKETVPATVSTAASAIEGSTEKPSSDRPLKQHIIQDSTGNLTSVTEGQILALQLDGESYMLVTCDEAGQLTPLNNEALTQLGPNLPSDLGNIVLQYQKDETSGTTEESEKKLEEVVEQQQEIPANVERTVTTTAAAEETVKCEVTEAPGGGQQLIVTGDPIAAQKFLESLTEGNTDFSNILANAEGGILIEHGGQQILINTDNQMILQENQQSDNVVGGDEQQQTDEQKFQVQDILAAALADTGVQQEQGGPNKLAQLSPNGANVFPPPSSGGGGGGAQLSLSLNSPIMSSQEQPSTNNKKIADDETDILTQIPKNVDLPITITDPNISGKVAQQQQQQINNIELNESGIMSSPSSLVYSLPTLDDAVDLGGQKSFHNMPLLTEDVDEQTASDGGKVVEVVKEAIGFDANATGVFMDEEGLCTLGGEMCNSLSEPPPDMFDIPSNSFIRTNDTVATTTEQQQTNQNVVHDNFVLSSANDDEVQQQQLNSSEENSCEIPIQPEIVVSNLTSSDNSNNTFETNTITESIDDNSSNCKFD